MTRGGAVRAPARNASGQGEPKVSLTGREGVVRIVDPGIRQRMSLDMSMTAEINTDVSRERIHNAVPVDLEARFMLPGGEEHACRIVEASTGELVFSTSIKPRYGDRIVVYVSELGRFEGDVERNIEGGFAIGLRLTENKHRKLAAQLVWFANRDRYDLPEARRHRRIVPRMQWTRVKLPDGKEKVVRINDVSLSGVSVESAAAIAVGDRVAFGLKTAVVGRIFEGGFVAQFEEPFADGELTEATRL